MNARIVIAALLFSACGHTRAADPSAAPQPWLAETAPPTPTPAPTPTPTPTPSPSPSLPRVAKDAEIPGEGAAHPFALPRPERARLSSGAELLLVRRPRLPLVSLYIVWPVGAADEAMDRAGLASLTADLLSEGAGKRTALEIAAELQQIGARMGTFASWDATSISITALTRSLDDALAIVGDVALRPRFESAEVERLRKHAQTALLQIADQASTQAALTGGRAIYGTGHRYGALAQGTNAGLAAITRNEIVAWHEAQLPISRATIIAVGDVEMRTLRPRLEKLFGGKRAAPVTRTTVVRAAPPPTAQRVLLVDKPGASQTEMRVYLAGPPRATPDYFPLLVLNTIFGGNFSSRLNSKLREEKGYTYGARSEFAFRREGGPFTAGAPVKTAVTRLALVDLRAELRRLADGAFADAELMPAKQTLQRSLAASFETPPEVARALAVLRVYGLPDDYFASYAQNIEAVTTADLKRVAASIRPEQMTVVLVGDEKTIGEEIRKELGSYEKIGLPDK